MINADTIEKYNRFFGLETTHPLVSVVRFDQAIKRHDHTLSLGFYALFLKQTKGTVKYGKTAYDFDVETVVSFAPGQTVEIHCSEGYTTSIGLLFHPDFLNGTHLAEKMKQYSFFSYASDEALHLSKAECTILQDYMERIDHELQTPVDKFTKPLIISNIEVVLNYCMRFYERQFNTRRDMNKDILVRFESLLDDYLGSDSVMDYGIPTVKFFADKICLSSNYFGDLVKSVTGKTAQEYIQLKMINLAKERVMDSKRNIKQISESLGFQHPQHFIRFFKRQEGCTPTEYKGRVS